MQVIVAQDHCRMPWKNGGGETAEIAVAPDGTGLADFDWRVSLARIARDGPFSTFPSVDRTFALLEGGPLRLRVGDDPPVDLVPGTPPLSFPADLPSEARLLGGPALAPNVMTRRGKVRHIVERLALASAVELAGGPALLVCQYGRVRIDTDEGSAELGPLDTLRIDAPSSRWALGAAVASILFVIRLLRAGSGTSDRGPSARRTASRSG
jgi:environmental stress-induced protein Ves